jgi:hypothetical protein
MDFSILAAKLAMYYPLQQRVNIMLQDMGMITPYVIFFGGLTGFVNTVITRDVIKDKINTMSTSTEEQIYLAISDSELREAVQQAWDIVGSIISTPVQPTSPTGPTGSNTAGMAG